jgi:hypothetical protein
LFIGLPIAAAFTLAKDEAADLALAQFAACLSVLQCSPA